MAVTAVLIAAAMLLGQLNAVFGEGPSPFIEIYSAVPLIGHSRLLDVTVGAPIALLPMRRHDVRHSVQSTDLPQYRTAWRRMRQ